MPITRVVLVVPRVREGLGDEPQDERGRGATRSRRRRSGGVFAVAPEVVEVGVGEADRSAGAGQDASAHALGFFWFCEKIAVQ